MTEKPKIPEPESEVYSEELEKAAKRFVAESIDVIAILEEFEKTQVGQEILNIYNLKSITEVFEDENIFYPVIAQLNSQLDEIDPMHFQVFLLMASTNYPDFISDAIKNDPDFQDIGPELFIMILQEAKRKGFEPRLRIKQLGIDKMKHQETGAETVDLEQYEGMNDQTKENIGEKIAMLREFEKSKVCQELLAVHGLTSIFDIFTDKDVFNSVADHVFKLLEELDEFADDSVEKQGLYFIVNQPPPSS